MDAAQFDNARTKKEEKKEKIMEAAETKGGFIQVNVPTPPKRRGLKGTGPRTVKIQNNQQIGLDGPMEQQISMVEQKVVMPTNNESDSDIPVAPYSTSESLPVPALDEITHENIPFIEVTSENPTNPRERRDFMSAMTSRLRTPSISGWVGAA